MRPTRLRHARGPRAGRVGAVAAAGVLVTATLLSAACSSSTPAERSDAQDAAATIAGIFQLGAEQQSCLQEGFEGDADALAVVGTTDEPSADDQEALAAVLDACVGADEFAAGFAARLATALPPTGTADGAAQVRCVTEQVQALDATDRQVLFVGLVAVTAPPTGPLALARGEVVNAITLACGMEGQL